MSEALFGSGKRNLRSFCLPVWHFVDGSSNWRLELQMILLLETAESEQKQPKNNTKFFIFIDWGKKNTNLDKKHDETLGKSNRWTLKIVATPCLKTKKNTNPTTYNNKKTYMYRHIYIYIYIYHTFKLVWSFLINLATKPKVSLTRHIVNPFLSFFITETRQNQSFSSHELGRNAQINSRTKLKNPRF